MLNGSEIPVFNNILFKIERSKDTNEVFYRTNFKQEGKLNKENPISIFWIKRANGNKQEPLTWIQKKYSYGLKFTKKTATLAEFQFVCYKKMTFVLKKKPKGIFRVFTFFGKKEVEVNRIFVLMDGGTFWFPKIIKVDIHATIVGTNTKIIETIKP